MGRVHASFDGEVAIVTGASSGIGLAIAGALTGAGAHVIGFDSTPPGSAPFPVRAVDVRDARAVKSAVDAIAGAEGRIDHLVNNAGCTRDRALWNLSEEDWSEVLDVNLTGAFHVLQSVAHHMRARRRGRIVQIASINGMRGRFGQANYAASKAGLIGLTRTAARELGPSGITVNAVAPGMIETPMTERLPEAVRSRALAETATGRLGLPADVVGAVLFLLSEQAAHVTGHVLVVDGGQLA